jgi:hypothetical protein
MVLSLIHKQISCADNLKKKWNNNTFIFINKYELYLFKNLYPAEMGLYAFVASFIFWDHKRVNGL